MSAAPQTAATSADAPSADATPAEVWRATLHLFSDDAAAARLWFDAPRPALSGRSPRQAAAAGDGGTVIALIGRLEHGVFT